MYADLTISLWDFSFYVYFSFCPCMYLYVLNYKDILSQYLRKNVLLLPSQKIRMPSAIKYSWIIVRLLEIYIGKIIWISLLFQQMYMLDSSCSPPSSPPLKSVPSLWITDWDHNMNIIPSLWCVSISTQKFF